MRSTAPTPKKDPRRPGEWLFVFDSVHPTASGGRRQVYRRGFTSKKEASLRALEAAGGQGTEHHGPVRVGGGDRQGPLGWMAGVEPDE